MKGYDYVLPYRTSLEKIGIRSAYEDYLKRIPGVHMPDLFILEDVFAEKYPNEIKKFQAYLSSSNKLMYQIFITKPEFFDKYCTWLFDILFAADKKIDTTLYSVNGRRTMGYLAELLYGYYFTEKINGGQVFRTGVSFLDEHRIYGGK